MGDLGVLSHLVPSPATGSFECLLGLSKYLPDPGVDLAWLDPELVELPPGEYYFDRVRTMIWASHDAKKVSGPDARFEVRSGGITYVGEWRLVALIDRAERSIDVQYYIWHRDLTGLLTLERLRSAADIDFALTFFPNLEESDRLRSQFDGTMSFDLFSDLDFKVTVYNRYDSAPPEGNEKNDTGVTLALSWEY